MIWKKWTLNTLLQFYYTIYQHICSLFHVHQINHRKCALYQHLLKNLCSHWRDSAQIFHRFQGIATPALNYCVHFHSKLSHQMPIIWLLALQKESRFIMKTLPSQRPRQTFKLHLSKESAMYIRAVLLSCPDSYWCHSPPNCEERRIRDTLGYLPIEINACDLKN